MPSGGAIRHLSAEALVAGGAAPGVHANESAGDGGWTLSGDQEKNKSDAEKERIEL